MQMVKELDMVNKSRSIAAVFALLVLLLSSCRNLPGKSTENPQLPAAATADGEPVSLPGSDANNSYTAITVWEEPSGDSPTVTPIIFFPEKRGETAPMIMREPVDQISRDPSAFTSNEPGGYTQISTPFPTAIPGNMQAAMRDEMELVSYNPRNNSTVLPGQSLHLDISLRNTGTTTWQTNYKVSDVSASPMAITKEYTLPYPVAPGGTVLISVYMAAPSALGNYAESFQIKDSYGVVFGQFEYYLAVGDFSVVTAIPTLTATITPTYYSPDGITATPDSLAWMCIDPERSKLQDCYSFCVEFSDRKEFEYCFYDGERYLTPVP